MACASCFYFISLSRSFIELTLPMSDLYIEISPSFLFDTCAYICIALFDFVCCVQMSSPLSCPAEHEDRHWPTLLHFAAEFNLTRVCEELLRFPGMIHPACTENSEGMFPSQLAERKGFHALQRRLEQYIKDMSKLTLWFPEAHAARRLLDESLLSLRSKGEW